MIGVGKADWFGLPSLPTGLADFPHPVFQLMVLPPRGLSETDMGSVQVVQPLCVDKFVRPT
jgi:hypothetical protein